MSVRPRVSCRTRPGPVLPLSLASRAARLFACVTLALVGLTATSSAGGPSASRFDALPRPGERLQQPIWLPHCQMRIVEWRTTAMLRSETTPTDSALAVIDDTCRDAYQRYGAFLESRHLPRLHAEASSMPAISLLPGNTLIDGKTPRALNDMPSRFESVAPGCCYWGLYVDSLNHLFLRNDPLTRSAGGELVANPRFVRTLTHEISHVLSARLGVWDAVGYDRQHDEDRAEAFVEYMGMHFPAESSAEDLAYHRGHTPAGVHPDLVSAGPRPPARTGEGEANTNAQR
jgi:hypothetical protein